jgi:hypothetical protein
MSDGGEERRDDGGDGLNQDAPDFRRRSLYSTRST